MSENLGSSLDSLMIGGGSEEDSESSEQLQARVAAAQARIKALKKDEKKSRSYDHHLAQIVGDFSTQQIIFIAFLIDHSVASEVILALFSIINAKAFKLCETESKKYKVGFNALKPTELKISVAHTKTIDAWWHHLYWADNTAKTGSLFEFNQNTEFISRFSTEMALLLKDFLAKKKITEFDQPALEELLNARGRELFFPNKK
jgi:hypothetical protein